MTNFTDYITGIGPLEWAGVAGFVCCLVAASLVAMSLLAELNLASALIQSSWILIGVTGLALCAKQPWPASREVLDTTLENGAS